MQEIPSQYSAKDVEAKLYALWEKEGVFDVEAGLPREKSFSIIQPPPNVTGVLHMGHALTCTIEDILTRWKRMQGLNSLWLPGTDHAGIATQMVVERNIQKEEKKSRHDLGREEFLKRVWDWKEKSQETILGQMKRIGCSVNWSRLTFTLDENVSLAVRTAFKRLYDDKLITREQAITQWCPRCHTALSDLEVKPKETKGKIWKIRYPLEGNPGQFLVVATTRPETLFGDTAVAVHPEDERFTGFHGKKVVIPISNRVIPVIADAYVDKEFGTGALKITPAHDVNDYEVGKRHSLAPISIFDESAKLINPKGSGTIVPAGFVGLSREKAREQLLVQLAEAGLLDGETDHTNNVGHCDRCGTVLEPRISYQWFVNAKDLAEDAIKAVEDGLIEIKPAEWKKVYFEWMNNIRPWCVSRQLWWGHRIPVWYCDGCSHVFSSVESPTKCEKCAGAKIRQDEDVLDTWFSSGLWPISTLGWPAKQNELASFYPTDVMETGFDILFFWVARMVMLCTRMQKYDNPKAALKDLIPFRTVYLHPMVRDEHGAKMSKTKGNVVDPLEIISDLGADSLRFFLTSNAYHGRDVRVSESGLESSRNFVTKIWNAARFVMMRFPDVKKSNVDKSDPINQWIWGALEETKFEVKQQLDQYRFFDAAKTLYHFVWDKYCFWFIEFIKGEEELTKRQAAGESTAVEVLEQTLRLLHPIMPFVTEELWQKLPFRSGEASIALAKYPERADAPVASREKNEVEAICTIIGAIRAVRGTHNLAPAVPIDAVMTPGTAAVNYGPKEIEALIVKYGGLVQKLAKVANLTASAQDLPSNTHTVTLAGPVKVFIPQSCLGDITAERDRKKKELADKREALARAEAKLANEKFTGSAPPAVVEGVRATCEKLKSDIQALKEYLGE